MTAIANTPVETTTPAVSVRSLSKQFGMTRALDAVTLSFAPGEVHGLVGENGAGKSTLGKLIGGLYQPDSGEISVFGTSVRSWDTKRAQDAGVVLIAQELSLVPALSVAQNVFLGREKRTFGVLHPGLEQRYRDLEELCGFGLPADVPVDSLSIADQQKVEIMRALARDARVIVMDEPTSSLTADEADRLHHIIAWLKSRGTTVIYVTHFLDDVLEHCDRVTVMRDGAVIHTSATRAQTKAALVEAMLGEPAEIMFPELPPAPSTQTPMLLEMRDGWSGSKVRGVSLGVRPGEIVGIAGLVGSGRTEIARVLFGADPLDAGTITLAGQDIGSMSIRQRIAAGMAMIPEDRRSLGLVLVRPTFENVTLPHLRRLSQYGVLRRGAERQAVAELVHQLNVRPGGIHGDISVYSGGNQQKVLFAKWLLGEPRLLILDEPTRGVDVGAKAKIYQLIADVAARGTAVILISSELEEVIGLSHRIYLASHGTFIDEVSHDDAAVDDILHQLFGVAEQPHISTPSSHASGENQ